MPINKEGKMVVTNGLFSSHFFWFDNKEPKSVKLDRNWMSLMMLLQTGSRRAATSSQHQRWVNSVFADGAVFLEPNTIWFHGIKCGYNNSQFSKIAHSTLSFSAFSDFSLTHPRNFIFSAHCTVGKKSNFSLLEFPSIFPRSTQTVDIYFMEKWAPKKSFWGF